MKPLPVQGRSREPWRRYLPWRGRIEVALWALAFAIPAVANTLVALMDAQRDGHVLPAWQPALWEGSSALMSLLFWRGWWPCGVGFRCAPVPCGGDCRARGSRAPPWRGCPLAG